MSVSVAVRAGASPATPRQQTRPGPPHGECWRTLARGLPCTGRSSNFPGPGRPSLMAQTQHPVHLARSHEASRSYLWDMGQIARQHLVLNHCAGPRDKCITVRCLYHGTRRTREPCQIGPAHAHHFAAFGAQAASGTRCRQLYAREAWVAAVRRPPSWPSGTSTSTL